MSRVSEPKPKSFEISKRAVWEAYRRVKANKGAAGVDGESIEEFEQDLRGNLYKLWNRLSSGSYFPPPVRAVEIPKKDGSSRTLGVPTVADRIAQTVVAGILEPEVEPVFHPDSYGYRPGRSAHDALARCRQRCWRYDWALDLDLKSFFDAIIERLAQVGLELNLDKTRIVYCKDADRTGSHEHERFDFLGYTFRPRLARSRSGGFFVSFCPAVADDAVKEIGRTIKRWRLHLR